MLDDRLLAVASLVRKDSYFCDIGTDHGYLPCYLVQNKITRKCIASDINEKPLKSAKAQIESRNLSEYIEIIKSDGLQNISSDVEDIAIAGMGGELIASIIEKSDFLRDSSKRLILQPMTNSPFLRKWIYQNGFEIISELSVIHKHMYCIMYIKYSGNKIKISELQSILGEMPKNKSKNALMYINKQLARINAIIDGLKKTNHNETEITKYLNLARDITELKEGCGFNENS